MHRVKAVRFFLPPEDEDEDEERENQSISEGALKDPEKPPEGDIESCRDGSQQYLAERQKERGMKEKGKAKRDFMCGLCCHKSPAVSVWNCDGEVLPYTEISCRQVLIVPGNSNL